MFLLGSIKNVFEHSACLSGKSSLRASFWASASKTDAVKYIFSAGSATPRDENAMNER